MRQPSKNKRSRMEMNIVDEKMTYAGNLILCAAHIDFSV
jgi:hypothetical protein